MVAIKQNELVIRLLKVIKERKSSIPKFANETGIPKDRIYKWKQDGTSPKVDDARTIENWINGAIVEDAPRETIHPEHGTTLSADFLAGKLQSKEDVIAQLEARRRDIERHAEELRADKSKLDQDKKILYDIINQNISLIREVLAPISSTSVAILNYQKAWVDFFSEVQAKGDKKEEERLIRRMNNIIDGKASGGVIAGKGQGAGKGHKQDKQES